MSSSPASTPRRRLHVVATSHLDTQWRWTFRDTIQRYIPHTLRANFELFRKHPRYEFNFEGAFRYMLAKEYWPELYEELKAWVAAGRWHTCGASVDAGDVNTVSPESLIRQALYGNGFFRAEFGERGVSRDIFLPDCFGFGWALPSVAAHCGLKSFSTSKLEWGSSCGIPFNVGFWEGVNGEGVVACINPGQYSFGLQDDWLAKEKWLERIDRQGEATGVWSDFKYFGLGDVGGAPDAQSAIRLEWAIDGSKDIEVISAKADALALSLAPDDIARLPRHRSEFLLIEHGTGTYTSHAEMKRWNRLNESLADAAEKASVAADWLGAITYPQAKLTQAWVRFLANQMHDILPGTSIPEAYQLSWNDEALSLNQFAAALKDAVGGIARLMDTSGEGTPVVVVNPLSVERTESLILPVDKALLGKDALRLVVDSETGTMVGAVAKVPGGHTAMTLVVTVPPLGAKVLRVLDAEPGTPTSNVDALPKTSDGKSFEDVTSIVPPPGKSGEVPGQRHVVRFDAEGRIRSIFDLVLQRELLSAPIDLQFLDHAPKEWPAWTIVHDDVARAPRAIVSGNAQADGSRIAEGSRFKQRVRFVQTAQGEAVEIEWEIDWRTPGTILKAAFPLAASNPKAVYDLGLGVVERGNNHGKLHEVPAQQWAHVTDKSGEFGVSIMADCKYGWDKPDDNTLRLTLVHSPKMVGFKCHLGGAEYVDHFLEQEQLDFGPHRVRVRIMGTPGDWRAGRTPWQAAALNQPLLAFVADKHEGPLGRSFSFAQTSSDAVAIKAIKTSEREVGADWYVVRLQEVEGREQIGVRLEMGAGIQDAIELNGMEEELASYPQPGPDGSLLLDFKPFAIRTIAVWLASAPHHAGLPRCAFADLPFDCRAISTNANRQDGDIDGEGHSLPSEQLPEIVESEGVQFRTGPRRYRQKNAVVCRGQRIELPPGPWTRVYALAAAVGGDGDASRQKCAGSTIRIGDREERFRVPSYTGFVGQWHDRVVNGAYETDPAKFRPAFVRRADVAWTCSHRHSGKSNADEAYQCTYLFKIGWDLRPGEKSIVLPDDSSLRVFAVTVARDTNDGVRPAAELFG